MLKYKKALILSSAPITLNAPPAALSFLAGICEHSNLEYDIFDFNAFLFKKLGQTQWGQLSINTTIQIDDLQKLEKTDIELIKNVLEEVVLVIKNSHADLILFTVFSAQQHWWSEILLSTIRSHTNAIIIAGGPGISYQVGNITYGRKLLDNNLIDYSVNGEGDLVLTEFLKGNILLGVNSKFDKFDSWVPQIDDLNSLVMPSYKKINFSDYFSDKENTRIIITGSRGCVRRCTFCDVGKIWKKFRFRSADNIFLEILKNINETNIFNFRFSDSLINGSLKQFTNLLEKICYEKDKNKNLKNITLEGYFIIRPQTQHSERMYELMSRGGVDSITVGIESGSERIRDHMGKKFSNTDIDYHMAMCSKYKIRNTILLLTGYPTETIDDHHDTLTMLDRYQKYLIDKTIIRINIGNPMIIYQDTPIWEMRHELGIEIYSDEYANLTGWSSKSNPDLTNLERFRRFVEIITKGLKLKYKFTDLGSIAIALKQYSFLKENKDANYNFNSIKLADLK
jgi:radical SAM superfamily enzyme YgiQ (UPF0313 family)